MNASDSKVNMLLMPSSMPDFSKCFFGACAVTSKCLIFEPIALQLITLKITALIKKAVVHKVI